MSTNYERASIGCVEGIRYDERNRRLKGILTRSIQNVSDIRNQLAGIQNQPDVTRITFRGFIHGKFDLAAFQKDLEDENISLCGIRIGVDAVIPLSRSVQARTGYSHIVYFGGNTDERATHNDVLEDEKRILKEAHEDAKKNFSPLPDGYTVELQLPGVSNWSDADRERIFRIYSYAFSDYVVKLDAIAVDQMIDSNIVGVVRDKQGKIVSVSQAELADVIVDGKWQMHLAELSDSATAEGIKVNNINYHIKPMLLQLLTEQGFDVIYSESRADLKPVLRNALHAGFVSGGILPSSCHMSSPRTSLQDGAKAVQSQYGDLHVMYLPDDKYAQYQLSAE